MHPPASEPVPSHPADASAPERAGRHPADASAPERAGRHPADASAPERVGRHPADGSAPERVGRHPEPAPAVIVVTGAPPPAFADALEREGAARLEAALLDATVAWGRTVGEVEVVARDELAAALSRTAPPVVAVGTDMPTLGAFHADALRADLDAGVDAVLGPAHDGGCYLLALGSAQPRLAALAAAVWHEPDALSRLLARAGELHLEGGLLRGERRLRTPGDARALLLHKALPAAVAAVLREHR